MEKLQKNVFLQLESACHSKAFIIALKLEVGSLKMNVQATFEDILASYIQACIFKIA